MIFVFYIYDKVWVKYEKILIWDYFYLFDFLFNYKLMINEVENGK